MLVNQVSLHVFHFVQALPLEVKLFHFSWFFVLLLWSVYLNPAYQFSEYFCCKKQAPFSPHFFSSQYLPQLIPFTTVICSHGTAPVTAFFSPCNGINSGILISLRQNSQDKINIISSLGQIWQGEGTSHRESVLLPFFEY